MRMQCGNKLARIDFRYAPTRYTYALLFLSIELTTPRSFVLAFLSSHVNHATNMVKGVYEFLAFFSASSRAYATGCIDQYWLRTIVKNSVYRQQIRIHTCSWSCMMEMKQHVKSKLFFFAFVYCDLLHWELCRFHITIHITLWEKYWEKDYFLIATVIF